MKRIFLILWLLTICTSNIFGATENQCREYESKYNKFINKFNDNPYKTKHYPLLMVKSYLDTILLECDAVIDISFYKKQKLSIKNMWNKYVPKYIRDLPQNKWK
jgi:hypothetical protein